MFAIMKMMLLLFLDNVRSERELMRIIPERVDYMWFLGYGLDDTVPNQTRSETPAASDGTQFC